MIDYAQARRMMVDCQLRTFDVNDNTVLDAFDTVPREDFVPKGREPFADLLAAGALGGIGDELRSEFLGGGFRAPNQAHQIARLQDVAHFSKDLGQACEDH